ncbi:MAG: DUF1499 domain-containing protein [Bacteroidota bacterium]
MMKALRQIFKITFLFLVLSIGLMIGIANKSQNIEPELGYVNKAGSTAISTSMKRELKACPSSPNCVSTQTNQPKKRMPALTFESSAEEAQEQLKAMIADMPRTKLLTEEPGYLHYAFTTWPIPFVDDVEFLFAPDEQQIHFRSASRVGHSDLGVNTNRMKKISAKWSSLAG